MRLKHVIVQQPPRPDRRVALELILRATAIAVAVLLILGLLPAIASVAG